MTAADSNEPCDEGLENPCDEAFEETLKSLRAQHVSFQQQFQQQLAQERKSAAELRQQLATEQQEGKQLIAENASLQTQLGEERTSAAELRQKLEQAAEQAEQVATLREQLKQAQDEAQQDSDAAAEAAASLRRRLRQERKQLKQAQRENASLRQETQQAVEEKACAQRQLEEERKAVAAEVATLQQQFEQAQKQLKRERELRTAAEGQMQLVRQAVQASDPAPSVAYGGGNGVEVASIGCGPAAGAQAEAPPAATAEAEAVLAASAREQKGGSAKPMPPPPRKRKARKPAHPAAAAQPAAACTAAIAPGLAIGAAASAAVPAQAGQPSAKRQRSAGTAGERAAPSADGTGVALSQQQQSGLSSVGRQVAEVLEGGLPATSSVLGGAGACQELADGQQGRRGSKPAAVSEEEVKPRQLNRKAKSFFIAATRKSQFDLFVDRVPVAKAPDYYERIQHPMCLRDIVGKARNGEYKEPEEIIADARLIISNALTYNDPVTGGGEKSPEDVIPAALDLEEHLFAENSWLSRVEAFCADRKLQCVLNDIRQQQDAAPQQP